MLAEMLYFFNVDPKVIDNLTTREYVAMFKNIKKLQKEHYFLASKTNPDFVSGENNHIETSNITSPDQITQKIDDYRSKVEPLKQLR